MLSNLILAVAFQVGPFYEQRPGYVAARPFYSHEESSTDVLWPVFTAHRDWWRFCLLSHYQEGADDSYQFDLIPLWFNGRTREGEGYAGLFPVYGHHPHIMLMHDIDFALWPLWMRYRMPRPSQARWMTTNTVLFPFFSWRDDGSWSLWPVYGINHQRESDHRYGLWPFITWADYRADRDTAGEGSSWMVWPLYGRVDREREDQWLVLPPLISLSEIRNGDVWQRAGILHSCPDIRLRCPWPFFEYESGFQRERLSIWPFYEHSVSHGYNNAENRGEVTRFGWKLIELYDEEMRVFPFWVGAKDYRRLWPFWESTDTDAVSCGRFLSLIPIRHLPQIDRNWAKFWTFYEREENPISVRHSLFWGIVRWVGVKW